MPSAINPKRIEDEVFERLSYREDCDIDDFMSLSDPDYSDLINEDNKSGGDETYNSVDEFMESLMI